MRCEWLRFMARQRHHAQLFLAPSKLNETSLMIRSYMCKKTPESILKGAFVIEASAFHCGWKAVRCVQYDDSSRN